MPEGCISAIISLTTAADAARSSLISKGFKSAAESDVVCERFLHQNELIISRSRSSPICTTKKELFLSLSSHAHIFLDRGNLSFSLDRWSGKKCFMVAPRALSIPLVENPHHWEWATRPDSRFLEVAILKSVQWLDIRGKIGTQMLSPGTNYAAYLVFKLLNDTYGIETLNAMVRIVNHDNENEAAKRATNHVYIPSMSKFFVKNKTDPLYEKYAKIRGDGWMEVQLEEFYNKKGDDGEVEARCMEIERLHNKSGLIVEGIDFRPKQ